MEDADPPASGLLPDRRSRKVNTPTVPSTRRTNQPERTYDEMSQENGEGSTSQPRFRQPASASLNRSFPPPPSPHRYHGDGFDFRRPVMSTSMPTPSGVIDLTDDTEPAPTRPVSGFRFPRSQRGGTWHPQRARSRNATSQPEIIDLEGDDDSEPQRAHTPLQHVSREGSPEVLYVSSNPLNNERSEEFTGSLPRSSAAAPTGSDYFHSSSITNSIGMQIARIFADGFRNVSFGRHHIMGIGSLTPHVQGRRAATQRNRRHGHSRNTNMHSFQTTTLQLPGDLDYRNPAFPFPIPEPAPRLPTYQKPPSPREGYTRAPGGDDVVVCPNCDHELGTGEEEIKKQVWVVRACGHVYCGECTVYRTKKSRQGHPEVTVPKLAHCVVEGCGKTKTSAPKSMIQVYI